ncbi:MAG: sodium:solute symporter [Bacteroidetes bacterium]|nr:sodium:solute symporter [Bacteroidota bacterium]MBS1541735.1 sodium:solute symporter [Bacteroidota bacterium]
MTTLDWLVLFGTLAAIVAYGTWKSRGTKSMETFIKGDQQRWWMVGLSIMATQASAVTFLSTTGQGMEDGMRFVQFYFGLPLAMIILSVTLLPIYYKLKVYTAYEYLESRFDLKTRTLAAALFLALRGLSVGITLFAPSLVLSTILGWNIFFTTLLIGVLVIIYTVSGGNNAVSITQRVQMTIILGGMFLAGTIAFSLLPQKVSLLDSVRVAGELGKLNIITTSFSWNDRYNIWSGLFASTFLFLSYFGTDQSQVARYINGKSLAEGRMGLLFNGLLKVPMQFFILFIGVLVFVFYLFNEAPMLHNAVLLDRAKQSAAKEEVLLLEKRFNELKATERLTADNLVNAIHENDAGRISAAKTEYFYNKHLEDSVRTKAKVVAAKAVTNTGGQDHDYAFLNFVLTHLPHGVIGLLLAVIFSAAMSSMSSELSALATTTMVDMYKRVINPKKPWLSDLYVSKLFMVMWAIIAICFAALANFSENLIQFVNIVGSLFYGTILGIFVVAFYLKKVRSNAVFWAAVVAEGCVLACYYLLGNRLAFLYYNIIGSAVVVVLSFLFQMADQSKAD